MLITDLRANTKWEFRRLPSVKDPEMLRICLFDEQNRAREYEEVMQQLRRIDATSNPMRWYLRDEGDAYGG